MSSSNYRRNKAALDAFRKDLEAEMGDLSEIDIKLLNQAVNEGVRDIKQEYTRYEPDILREVTGGRLLR